MKRAWLILVSTLFVAACSSSGGNSGGMGGAPGTGGAGGADAGLTYPHLDCDPLVPEFCNYPFPSNVYTVEDGSTVTGRRVSFGSEFLQNNDSTPWDYSDGFSAGSPILTYLPGATDAVFGGIQDIDQSLSEDSPTLLLDAETGELVPHFAQIDVQALQEPGIRPEQVSSMLRPVVRLRDNARYIVAFRNVTNGEGAVIEPSAEFAALRDGTQSDEESIEARRELYEDIFAKIEAKGWSRDELQIAWDFNTASDENNTRWLLHMRDTAFELLEDGIEYTITREDTEFPGEGGNETALRENARVRIFGTFKVPLFMSSPEPGSLLLLDDNDMPMVNPDTPWADIPFEVVIPKSASAENPAPIVEYGHGLFGEKEQIHTGGGHFTTFMNEYNYIFCSTDLQGMSGSDFQVVIDALTAGKFSDIQTMWDRLHQGFLNHLVLLRMMKTTFAEDPKYGEYIKADEAYYHGISQGGIMGSVVLATSDDISRGALGVMGQPYSFLLFRSVDFDQFLVVIRLFYNDYRMAQALIGLAQMPWDRVEPNGYSHHITENTLPGVTNPKEVLMRTAIGDHQVTTYAGHVMARTMNAKHLTTGMRDIWRLDPAESTASGSFYTEYDFALPGEPFCNVPMSLCGDPHEHPRRREAARKQLDEFLRNGTGTNYCAPGDADEHQATEDGVCSYPTLSGCEPDETDAQILCEPDELEP